MKKKNNGKEHNAQLTETNIMLLITKGKIALLFYKTLPIHS